jgi:K+-transporting ATPase KdpF subunit
MSLDDLVGLAISLCLTAYLGYALIRAERF